MMKYAYNMRTRNGMMIFFVIWSYLVRCNLFFLNSKGTPGNFHSNIADPLAESNLEASTKLCISLEFDLYNLEIG